MTEQLSYDLYKWLSSIDVVPATLRYKSNGNYLLDHKTAEALLNGSLISKLLQHLASQSSTPLNQPLLSSIKQSSTPAARIYNWNILAENFLKINISLPKEMQKQITSGNFSTLLRFLLDIHKRISPKKMEKKQQNGNTQINLKKLQVLQSYEEAENFIELVIMIISDNLSLTPKQTLSTLNENAKYYAHMVVKGIKNSFAQILDMLDSFMKQLGKLMYFCESNPQSNTQFLLDLIKPTLISRDSEVAKKGAQFFKLTIEQSRKYNSKNIIYQLLTAQSAGFDFLYMGLKRHPDLVQEFSSFVYLLASQALPDFFEVHLKRTINNQQEYLKIVIRLLEGFSDLPEGKTAVKESGLLEVWLKNSQASFNNKVSKDEGSANQQTKLLYLQLLCNLWKEYGSEIDEERAEDMLRKGIYQLKKNTRNQIYTIKIPALLRLFDFLHFLADSKNHMASILYKQLIFLLIENHDQTDIRQIILNNFSFMLKQYPTIPVDYLLQPFLKQLATSEGKTYILNVFDFQFMLELCKHPKMDASFGLSYLQYLTKLYIKSYIYAKLTGRVIKLLTSRFCEEETIIEFLKKTIDSTLNQYGVLTFNKTKISKEETIINKQKQSLSIELIKHFIQLEHQGLKQFILHKVVGLYLQWLQQKHHTNKGLKYLLELFGDVDEICLKFKVQQNQRQSRTPSEFNEIPEQSYNPVKPTTKSEAYRQMEYMKQKGIGYKERRKPNKTHGDSQMELNSLKPAPKALEELERIKQRLREEVDRKRQLEDIQLRKVKQKNSRNSIQLIQRNLSLGYAKITPQLDDNTLFQFGSVKQKQLKGSIRFYSLRELEEMDKSTAQVIFKLYTKEVKALYLRYALISNGLRREQSAAIMSFTAVIKMLNEKGLGLINKLVVSDLISSINSSKRKEKNILYGLEEEDFNEFLVKLTDYLVQTEQSAPEVPFGLRLQKLLKTLLTGENFYQNRLRIKEDPKISRVKQVLNTSGDSQFLIPEGFKKVKENTVQLTYMVDGQYWGVSQRYKIGYELADWLIFKCLGLHILTPIVQIKQKYNLVQIPKTIKLGVSKQQTDPHIKLDPQENQAKIQRIGKSSQKNGKAPKRQRRSQSQREIHKNKKEGVVQSEQEKEKQIKKRLLYAQQLKDNLERMRREKALKQEEKQKAEAQKQERAKKKEEERKKYLEMNKQKIKNFKQKESQEEKMKKQQEKMKQQKLLESMKKREKEMLEKHMEDLRKIADKATDKKKHLQNSKDKLKQTEKPSQPQINQQYEEDKARMQAVKNSLQNGFLKNVAAQYNKQLNQIFQAYWTWDKKRIDLKSMALMLKDFEVSPQYVPPKILADTFKPMSKGQPLDYEGFVQCLAKCGYRSKLMKESSGEQVDSNIFIRLLQLLKMKEGNYKQVVHKVKNHVK